MIIFVFFRLVWQLLMQGFEVGFSGTEARDLIDPDKIFFPGNPQVGHGLFPAHDFNDFLGSFGDLGMEDDQFFPFLLIRGADDGDGTDF